MGFRQAALREAHRLGLHGWVRNAEDGTVAVHAEGEADAIERFVAFLRSGPPGAVVSELAVERVRAEGHEQFAVRGVSAGGFLVLERPDGRARFELALEVAGALRTWALPRSPSMDPAQKRLAIETEGRAGRAEPAAGGGLWDSGSYEQGGRVPWPEALARGHAVFVLHGERLSGGFALQRTGVAGERRWLLVKRRDDHARPCPAVAERRR